MSQLAGSGRYSEATFLAVAAAIAAADVMAGAKEFVGVGKVGKTSVRKITATSLLIEHTALVASEAGYSLYLYTVTPPSALADNAAWDLPSGDRASYVGKLALGTPVDLGATLYVRNDAQSLFVPVTATGSLFGYLVTDAGITPTAANRIVRIYSHEV